MSLISYVTENGLSIIVGGTVTGGGAFLFRRREKRQVEEKAAAEKDQAVEEVASSELKTMVRIMYRAFVPEAGGGAFSLNDAPLGIMDTVRLIRTDQLAMKGQVDTLERTITDTNRRVSIVEKELTQNGGVSNTALDRLGRIEQAVTGDNGHSGGNDFAGPPAGS